MLMIHKENTTVSRLTGAAMSFQAGVPREVPKAFEHDAVLTGAMPYIEGMPTVDDKPAPTDDKKAAAKTRMLILQNAIKELIAGNDPQNFKTTDGSPRVDAVRTASGFEDVTSVEVAAAFALVSME